MTSEVVDDEPTGRFTSMADGATAELVYRREGDRLVLEHTRVPRELEGRGVGGDLVTAAIAKAAAAGLTVVPECPFARGWLARHPDVAGRVRIERPSSG